MRRRWRRPTDGLPLPFQIQLLEADHLDTRKHGKTDTAITIQGIEYDLLGRVQAYWLFPEHPGDSFGLRVVNAGTYGTYFGESMRVPAEDVIHFKRLDRIGQVRGIPWGAPSMLVLRDFDDYLDAQLLRQKIAACFTIIVHDLDSAVETTATDTSKKPLQEIQPGTIRHLPPGKTMDFARPPGVEDILDYSMINLRSVAAGYGVTYEQLTGDLKGVSFSGGRLGMLKFRRRNRNHQRIMMIPKLAKAWRWFGEAGVMAGAWPAAVPATWTVPGQETIDPMKETQARRLEVRSGFKSLPEAIREMGYDPDKIMAENAAMQELANELDLVVESLPAQDKGRQAGAKKPVGGNGKAPADE